MATLSITVPTRIGSIIINGLSSPSAYIDSFIVELYTDIDLTDLVAQSVLPTVWNGTASVQAEPYTFSGLPVTSLYYLRVGTASSTAPIVSWSDAVPVALSEDNLLNSITYGGSYSATSSGVSYQVRPSGAPDNVDHYEAVYTVNTSTTPDTTATPHWVGLADASGLLTFGAIGAPGQIIRMYVRAVDTAANYQDWTLISTLTVTASGFSGNLDQIPDGFTFARVLKSGLVNGVPDARQTTGITKLGSLSPTWSGTLFWSATATSSSVASISLWWDQLVLKRIDGSQTVIGARAQTSPITITGLTPSTSGTTLVYNVYPYVDEFTTAVNFVDATIQVIGGGITHLGTGSPPYAYPDPSLNEDLATSLSQLMNRQDRLGLGPVQVSMPIFTGGGSTSGGGGGFGGTCPRGDMKVRRSDGTVIRADEIKPGDKLITTLEYGVLLKVLSVRHEPCSEWIEIHTTKGSVIVHPDTHLPVEDQHGCVMAKDLTLSHLLKSRRGSARITDIRLNIEGHNRVILTCDRSKVFLCGVNSPDLVIHNTRLANC